MSSSEMQVDKTEMGGMTVFPQGGIQIPVETGAAVMWHNFLRSGALDLMPFHSGCPVIFGEKRSKSLADLLIRLPSAGKED